jgi:hypothetical protein
MRDSKAHQQGHSAYQVQVVDQRQREVNLLAATHARSGDPVAMAAYLGKSDEFDRSITDFSQRYADQNDQDYKTFADAVRSGRLEALQGV